MSCCASCATTPGAASSGHATGRRVMIAVAVAVGLWALFRRDYAILIAAGLGLFVFRRFARRSSGSASAPRARRARRGGIQPPSSTGLGGAAVAADSGGASNVPSTVDSNHAVSGDADGGCNA